MNKVDIDKDKFAYDEYGNLIPKDGVQQGFTLTDEEIEQCGTEADDRQGKELERCPDCLRDYLVVIPASLYTPNGDEIEVNALECPACGYIEYPYYELED